MGAELENIGASKEDGGTQKVGATLTIAWFGSVGRIFPMTIVDSLLKIKFYLLPVTKIYHIFIYPSDSQENVEGVILRAISSDYHNLLLEMPRHWCSVNIIKLFR